VTAAIFDAHHHLWDTRVLDYALFRNLPALERPFLLADYEEEARRLGVTGSLWVEAASAGADPVAELAWVREQVGGSSLVRGLVAYVALERIEGELERLSTGCGPPVVGVRRSFEFGDPGFPQLPEVIRGARAAGEQGLVVDLVLFPPALPAVLDLVGSCPGTQFVLDHLGKPEIRAGGWEPWATQLRELAARPNVVAKLSGLATEAHRSAWTPAGLQRYVDHALDVFGAERLLYGSDWPVLELAGGHGLWLEAVENLLAGLSASERSAILAENAERTYFG
jgi:L-fuconolactonase